MAHASEERGSEKEKEKERKKQISRALLRPKAKKCMGKGGHGRPTHMHVYGKDASKSKVVEGKRLERGVDGWMRVSE